jgi:hypothetical protein
MNLAGKDSLQPSMDERTRLEAIILKQNDI